MELTDEIFQALQTPFFFNFLGIFVLAYLILAGGSYAYLYLLKTHPFSRKKIQIMRPSNSEIGNEILWSILSLAVWSVMVIIVVVLVEHGYTYLYFDLNQYGLLYFFFTIFLLIVTHDAYFYWTHRLMHSRLPFFGRIHDVHHKSLNPTPFAIYAFGPFEAVLLGFYAYIVIFIMPIHIYALLALFIFDTIINAIGHFGYEFLPSNIHTKIIGKVFNTSTHHNLHHQYGRSNYASYFTFWDSFMKTMDTKYKETWNEVHSR